MVDKPGIPGRLPPREATREITVAKSVLIRVCNDPRATGEPPAVADLTDAAYVKSGTATFWAELCAALNSSLTSFLLAIGREESAFKTVASNATMMTRASETMLDIESSWASVRDAADFERAGTAVLSWAPLVVSLFLMSLASVLRFATRAAWTLGSELAADLVASLVMASKSLVTPLKTAPIFRDSVATLVMATDCLSSTAGAAATKLVKLRAARKTELKYILLVIRYCREVYEILREMEM